MRTRNLAFGSVWCLALLAGCVERRFIIESDPPGAMVYMDNQQLGQTPVDVPFVYYGTYQFTLVKDGFQTKTVRQELETPIYAYPPLDFAAENLYPGTLRYVKRFTYQLDPITAVVPDQIFAEADALRERGRAIPPQPKQPSTQRPIVGQPIPVGPTPVPVPPSTPYNLQQSPPPAW